MERICLYKANVVYIDTILVERLERKNLMKVLIIGAGIGGLTAALELERAGIEAYVFESVAEVRPLGVGINLLPHAIKNLTRLGLLDTLLQTGLETKDLSYYNKYGKEYGANLVVARRATTSRSFQFTAANYR